jgi:hypothetical protein
MEHAMLRGMHLGNTMHRHALLLFFAALACDPASECQDEAFENPQRICAEASFPANEFADDDLEELNDAGKASLECILVALRDRTPGLVSWVDGERGDVFWESWSLTIASDGRARAAGRGDYDLESCSLETSVVELRRPDYFDDCLAQTSVEERRRCLIGYAERQLAVCSERECHGEPW